MPDTDLHPDLQALQKDLREMGSLSDEQIQSTTASVVGHVKDLAEIWFNRSQKASIEVTRKPLEANTDEQDLETDPIQVIRKRPEEELGIEVDREEVVSPRALDDEMEPESYFGDDLEENKEVLYNFDKHQGAEFAEGISELEAQAILDLMTGVEGTRINNGENLLITSNGKKLFETNSKGEVTFSIAQRDPSFNRRTNPIKNSLQELKERSESIVRTAQTLKDDIQVARGNSNDSGHSIGQSPIPPEPMPKSPPEVDLGDMQTSQPAQKPPDVIFEEIIGQSTILTADSNLEAQEARDKEESIITLRNNLQEGEKVEISAGVSLQAERDSDGIVQIKMFEIDNPEPVTIAKVNEQGDVLLDQEYTAPRYEAVNNFVKNQELSQNVPGKSPVEASIGSVDQQDDSRANGSKSVLNTAPPLVGGELELPTAEDFRLISQRSAPRTVPSTSEPEVSPTAETSVSKSDLKNLDSFYKSSEGKTLPEAVGFSKRLGSYKQSLINSAQQAEGNNKLTFSKISLDYGTNCFQLSPEDQGNLASANNLAQAHVKSSPEVVKQQSNGRT